MQLLLLCSQGFLWESLANMRQWHAMCAFREGWSITIRMGVSWHFYSHHVFVCVSLCISRRNWRYMWACSNSYLWPMPYYTQWWWYSKGARERARERERGMEGRRERGREEREGERESVYVREREIISLFIPLIWYHTHNNITQVHPLDFQEAINSSF